ncbi:MAG TPA: hypothetical protein VFV70_09365, partial [Hyphomonadaceae bacterium]|nr:hypothetical protein [Hyphomonadaceae bacterium]
QALLRWVIARQAFRLCGLDPKLARIQPLSEAKGSLAWHARNRTFVRIYRTMTLCARRLARRIVESVEFRNARPCLSGGHRAVEVFLFFSSDVFWGLAAPAGERIRAPPGMRHPKTIRPRLAGSPARSRAFVFLPKTMTDA